MKQHRNKASHAPIKRLAAFILVLALCLSLCGCAQGAVDMETFLRAANEVVEAVQNENSSSAADQPEQTGTPAQGNQNEPEAIDLSTYTKPLDEAHVQTGVIELDGEAVESMYVDNELVLFAEDGAPREDIEKLVAPYGAEVVGYIENADLFQLELPNAMSADELSVLVTTFNEMPDILYCSCNMVTELQNDAAFYPNDLTNSYRGVLESDKITEEEFSYAQYYADILWGHTACNVPQAWEIVKLVNQNPNVLMGLIDDSMDITHKDLHFTSYSFWNGWNDELSGRYNPRTIAEIFPEGAKHGTHVAGIMGARNNNTYGISGIALNASLIGVATRINDNLKGRCITSFTELAGALGFLLDSGVWVVNMSIGSISDKKIHNSYMKQTKYMLNKYLRDDEHSKFIIVTSAGNYNEEKDPNCSYNTNYTNTFAQISDKKLKGRILVVGNAKGDGDTYSRAIGSCYKGGRVDVMAPGTLIYSTVPYGTETDYDKGDGCDYLSGTSMASPFVAGLAGLIWEANPNLSPERVKEIIVQTADIHVEGSDVNMVNAEAAVLEALGYDPRPEEDEESEALPEDELLSEDKLAERFRAEMTGTEDFFVCDDFDGDGTLEAFGGSSEPDGSNWWRKLHVYYIDSYGSVFETDVCPELGVFSETHDVLSFGKKRLLFICSDPATGIGFSGTLVGVRNGEPYIPDGMLDLVYAKKEGTLGLHAGVRYWSSSLGMLQTKDCCYLFDETTGEFIPQDDTSEIEVVFDHRFAAEEYAIISGVDADGKTLWTLETSHHPAAQCDAVVSIGVSDGLYYYSDGGIVAVNLKDGSFVWRSEDSYAPSASVIGEDGTIYLCCWLDLDFAAIDKYGNTLARIDKFAEDSLWPDQIELVGDKIKITETYNDQKVFYVDWETYAVTR